MVKGGQCHRGWVTRWPRHSRMSSCRHLLPFPTCRPQYIIFIVCCLLVFFISQGGADSTRANVGFTGRRLKSPSSLLWSCSHPAPAATAAWGEQCEKPSALAGIFQKHSSGIIPGTGTPSLKGSPERMKHPVSKLV